MVFSSMHQTILSLTSTKVAVFVCLVFLRSHIFLSLSFPNPLFLPVDTRSISSSELNKLFEILFF